MTLFRSKSIVSAKHEKGLAIRETGDTALTQSYRYDTMLEKGGESKMETYKGEVKKVDERKGLPVGYKIKNGDIQRRSQEG